VGTLRFAHPTTLSKGKDVDGRDKPGHDENCKLFSPDERSDIGLKPAPDFASRIPASLPPTANKSTTFAPAPCVKSAS
jgi:hypothetical protein